MESKNLQFYCDGCISEVQIKLSIGSKGDKLVVDCSADQHQSNRENKETLAITEIISKSFATLKDEISSLRQSNIDLVRLMSSEDFRKPHREAIINKNIIVEGDQRELAEKQIDNRIDHDSGNRSHKVKQKKQSFVEAVKTLKVSKDKPKMILNKQVRKSTPDKDPVNSNKKKRENALNGTGDQNDLLQPAPKGRNWIWLGGLHSNTTVENIKAYTGMKWPDRDVLCFDLKSKSPKKSFKVGMIDISQEELLQPESWPSGVKIRLFRDKY